jgi:hypothetical protein
VTERVELSVPARAEFLSLARLHVAAVASMVEMTIDELEDLNLAVEELCLTLLSEDTAPEARLRLEATFGDDLVEVTARIDAAGEQRGEGLPDPLSQRILDALVDEHGTSSTGTERTAWLRKRRERRTAEA